MKESTRLEILRFVALIEITLYIYILSFVLRIVFLGKNWGSLSFLLFFTTAMVGYAVGRFIYNEESKLIIALVKAPVFKFLTYILNVEDKKNFIAKIVSVFTMFLLVLAIALVYRLNTIPSIVFELVFVVLPFRIAYNSSRKHYHDIMSNGVVYFGFFVLTAALVASSFYVPLAGVRSGIYMVFYLYILIFLILMNQEDIDDNIYSKKYIQKSILPRNMRSFNLISVLVLFAIILLIFNMKTIVASIIGFLAKLSARLIKIALWLISFIFPKGEVQQGGQGDESLPFQIDNTIQNHSIWNIISYILAAAVIIYLLYKLMPVLFRKFGELLARVKDNASGDYDDETVTVRPAKEDNAGKLHKRRKFKVGRELANITDPVERVRYKYGLILNMLDMIGIGRIKSDTAAEICKKTSGHAGISHPLIGITRLYEKVRYGDFIPENDDMKMFDKEYTLTVESIRKK